VAHNDGDDNLLDLEVELVLPNDADAVGDRSDISRHERLPERPRAFGTNLLAGTQLLGGISLNPRVPSGVVTRRSDGVLRITLPEVEVRPRNRVELHPVTILLPLMEGRTELGIGWRATARGLRGVTEGSFSARIAGEAMLAKILSRPAEEDGTID